MTTLASDLRVRGAMERGAIARQYETFRAEKHAAIDAAHDDALKVLEGYGKLDAAAARKAADRFGAMHDQLDSLVDSAKGLALDQTRWFDLAAETVLAAKGYYQAKDQAWIEGGKSALESFGASYAATRREPADATEAKAQGLMDQLQAQLRGMLEGHIATPK
jgi:hypothetical protein